MNILRRADLPLRLCLGFLLILWQLESWHNYAAGPEPAGWFSGDIHVHRSCGGAPVSVQSIYDAAVARDLAVISLLADSGNGEVQNPATDLPLVNGADASISTPGRIIHWDTEWHWDATYSQYAHQALGGHILTLGMDSATQIWQESTYNIFQWAHQHTAIAGFAHLQYLDESVPSSLSCCTPIEYPVEVALGGADFISEDVAGSDTAIHAYYRLLNCGLRPGWAGGSDYPCSANIGDVITYVRTPGGLTYDNWINGIALGRTVVSRNAHNEFLDFKVNSTAQPGDEMSLAGPGTVSVSIQWSANQNLSGTIELVQNGQVIGTQSASVSPSSPSTFTTTATFQQSGWLCARRMSGRGHEVHTAAIFVKVNNQPVRTSVADAQFYVQWMDTLLSNTSPGGIWNSYYPTQLATAQSRYNAAKAYYQQVAVDAANLQPVSITTSGLPAGTANVAYSSTLSATGGKTPYTWSVVTGSGSLPPGLSLNSSSGVISGTPTATGTFSFTVQVNDANNPSQTATKPLTITIGTVPIVTIWPSTTVPGTVDGGPDSSVELGVKFQSDVAGNVAGIRFYKGSANTGTHTGSLWTSTGTLLGTATFTGETASGWQQVNFTTPVSIAANTVYVASYHVVNGHYSQDANYFATARDNPPLHALSDASSGGNCVYSYGASTVFPNSKWMAANYWVDVVFQAGPPPALSSIAVTPANATIATGTSQQFTATGTYSDGSTQNLTSQVTWNSSLIGVATINSAGLASAAATGSTTISATLSGVTGSTSLTVQATPLSITTASLPNGTLNTAYSGPLAGSGGKTPYTWSLATGTLPTGLSLNPSTGAITGTPTAAGTVNFTARVTDSSNPVQNTTKALSITVDAAQPISIWPSTTVPGTMDSGPDSSVELGVKFQSDVAGTIRGIRFYKSSGNTGTHTGTLWSSTGTQLATVTFTGESASGWQQMNFATPVSITPNTTYVASYHAANGHYAQDVNYFTTQRDNPPLHALADSSSGGNCVYRYGASTVFPNLAWSAANYWVDVSFLPAPPPSLSSIAVTPANSTIVSGATQQFTATGTYSDGSTQNLTTQATWASSLTAVAQINAAGLATAASPGSTTISATLSGVTGSTTLTVQPPPLSITTTTLPNGTVNTAYPGAALAATGGTTPYTWSISVGALPTGLILNPNTGAITGTPTVTGTVNFTARVTDSSNPAQAATKVLSITITTVLTSIAVTPANPTITVGSSQQFTATGTYSDGSTQNLTTQVTWGSSATGVAQISAAGLATGASVGSTTISATLSGKSGSTTLTVQPAPLSITTASVPNGTVNVAYSGATLAASGGTTPYTWSISAGALPTGLTLNPSTGAINGTPTATGTFNFTARATDSGNPVQSATKALSINVSVQAVTIWPSSTVPGTLDSGPDSSSELGVKFRSDVAGTISGIRFYKSSGNTGTHTGTLWSSTGTQLATATFTGETASGWQQVNFSNPVAITANTTYVASYHAASGHYAQDVNYFATQRDNPPLHALSDSASGGNCVYRYGASTVFPNLAWMAANYWVDVVFVPGPPPTLNSVSVTPANPTISTGTSQQFTATGTYSDGSTQNLTAQVTWTSSTPSVAQINSAGLASANSAGTTTISATLAGVTGSTVLTVQLTPLSITTGSMPSGTLNIAYSGTLTASGGTPSYVWSISVGSLPTGLNLNPNTGAISGTPTVAGIFNFTARVTDFSNPIQATTKALTITINASQPISLWPATTVPTGLDSGADPSVELGVKFRSDVAGTIQGIRYYKSSGNTGTHTGSLWTSTGTLLATATFTGETASGWQQANFSSPVSIAANTIYVASYHANNGHYAQNANYFATGRDTVPLHAPSDASSGGNGVYRYGASTIFPNQAWSAANYWVDVAFLPGPPSVISVNPSPSEISVYANAPLKITFNQAMNASTISGSTVSLRDGANALVPGTVSYNSSSQVASLVPSTSLVPGTTYTAAVKGGGSGVADVAGGRMFSDYVWSFKTISPDFYAGGPGGPILIVTNAANPFTMYYAEILLTEGFNQFALKDISTVGAPTLTAYDVVVLGEVLLTPSQVTMFTDWVNAGGKLIAFRPDKQLANLLGIVDAGTTLSEGYVLINTASGPGVGIVNQTMQFHGTADRYTLGSATSLGTLYSNASTATANPAVTLRSVGLNGGQAAAFTYDLAKSVVYTRQGNPAWSGQERDGLAPIRPDDLFYGADIDDPKPDWVDFNKIAIPQADEQQRLVANMVLSMESDKKLLPRFWYFPHGHKAAVVMTGDDHASNGTEDRFDQYISYSSPSGSVQDWETVRSSSYMYANTPISDSIAAIYNAMGFDLSLHLNTVCTDYTASSLNTFFSQQISQFKAAFPSLPAVTTHRIHCFAWSSYTVLPETELSYGIRMNVSYYYWPTNWVANRPGLFTGSGMAMRFAKSQGNVIDVYQATTQMNDESGQTYPFTCDTLLNRALGPEGYYGSFVALMHTDVNPYPQSDAIIQSAQSRGVPVISARQLLTWLDSRNASSISSVVWSNNSESFSISAHPAARGLEVMVPVPAGYNVTGVNFNGGPVLFSTQTIKGLSYAVFDGVTGNYQINFAPGP